MDENSDAPQVPDSLLPYSAWMQDAMRDVVLHAVEHAAVHGLPGGHHFYITFRTDHPETVLPARLRAQYPQEMTIVLQHQFSGLAVDRVTHSITVGLSFGGVPARLVIPATAVVAFTDPEVQFGLRFDVTLPSGESPPEAPSEPAPAEVSPEEKPQVVSLDAFRRRRD